MLIESKMFILDAAPHAEIKKLVAVIMVEELGETRFPLNKFVLLDIFFRSKNSQIAQIQREIHLVEKLNAILLIGVDIQSVEGIVTNPRNSTITIRSCNNLVIPASVHMCLHQSFSQTVYSNHALLQPGKITNVVIKLLRTCCQTKTFVSV